MANTNKRIRNRQPAKSYSLVGDNNWETALNTFNFGLGFTMTAVWGTGRLVTTSCEAGATFLPETVANALVDTACESGVGATWSSFRAEDSTDAISDYVTEKKDSLLGAKDDATDILGKEVDNKPVYKSVVKLMTNDQRAESNVKILALSNDEYDAFIDEINAALKDLTTKDTQSIVDYLASL